MMSTKFVPPKISYEEGVRKLITRCGSADIQKYFKVAHQIRLKPVSQKEANDIDFVKGLLNLPKESAIFKLADMLRLVNVERVVETYIKTLPVYFVYAEVNKICLNRVGNILEELKTHPLFKKHQSLFAEWQQRFEKLNACTSAKGKSFPAKKETAAVIKGTQVIGYFDLEFFVALQKWLKYHKIHKYSYFFANLTFDDFENLHENTIDYLCVKIGLIPITTGARGTILRRMKDELNDRVEKLQEFCNVLSDENIGKCLLYLKKILHTPIRKQSVLPNLLERVISNVIEAILSGEASLNLHANLAIRLLQSAYSCHFFQHHQKSKFNTFRCQLKGISKQLSEGAPTQIDHEQELMRNLRRIELELIRMMED